MSDDEGGPRQGEPGTRGGDDPRTDGGAETSADPAARGVDEEVTAADRAADALSVTVAGAAGFVASVVTFGVLAGLASAAVGPLSGPARLPLSSVATGLGTATVGVLFLYGSGRTLSFLDVRMPGRRDLAWGAAGIVGLLAAQLSVEFLYGVFDVRPASHSLVETARQEPQVLLVLIALSWLFVGPGEELLYRNVIQKSLYDSFSKRGAVVVTSVVFAAAHFTAFAGGSALATAASLGLVFFLSLLLGTVFLRTENLLVCALVHGTFNAVQFAVVYGEVATAGPPF